uniref:UTP23 sensor motif region domain-containing protein n=1 Tax=Oncorhynchus tshawytscha TaxID=74940 RepID=A0A8C8DBI8_ONCTS
MKIKRQNFREPFQILIDGTFCQAALKNKIQIKEQLLKYLMGEVQLCTTNCALKELESTKDLYGAKLILQRYQVRNCKHFKNPVSAVTDQEVTSGLKKIPGVPLLYIILNTIVLDKPKMVTPAQQQSINNLKEVQGIGQDGERQGKKRKRKFSNPNPLSCLKKKKQTQLLTTEDKKKSRQRSIPKTNPKPLVVGRDVCFEGRI